MNRKVLRVTFISLALVLASCGGSGGSSSNTSSAASTGPSAGSSSAATDASAMTTDAPASSTSDSTSTMTAPTATTPTGELSFAAPVGPRNWDPHPETRAFAYGWYDLVYDGLLTTNAAGEIVPGLATDWSLSADKLELTLRNDVNFQDGTPFNADAVSFNIEKGKGAPGVTGEALSVIEQVEAVDEQHIVLHLSEAAPDLPNQLASFAGLMVSPAVAQADLEAGAPAGTGPYVIDTTASKPDSEWVFTANPKFWDPSVEQFSTVSGLIIADDSARANALSGGDTQIGFIRSNQVDQVKNSGMTIVEAPTNISVFQILDVNGTLVPEFANPDVRVALAHAIDPSAFVQVALAGTGAPVEQLFASGQLGYVDGFESPGYDPDLAKQMLAEAGVTNLTFSVPAFGPFAVGAQVLQAMFADVGVTMTIDTVTPAEMTSKIAAGEYPAAYTFIPDRHPQSVYTKQLRPGSVYNPFPAGLAPVEQAEQTVLGGASGDALNEAFSTMFKTVYTDGWIVPIAQNTNAIAVRPEGISNVEAWTGIATFVYTRGIKHS